MRGAGRAGVVAAVLVFGAGAGAHAQTRPLRLDPAQLLAAPFHLPQPQASAGPGEGAATRQAAPVRFGPRQQVPQLPCRPGDRPETEIQGRVPPSDTASLRALQGYNCNLEVVGRHPIGPNAGTFEVYGDCAYYGLGSDVTGTMVMDVSDPARPIPTEVLATPAMLSPWESLKVNAKRKLLVADHWTLLPADTPLNHYLDIYDVSADCRHPKLISSTDMSPATGHEGWFSPDGLTYFMSSTGPDGAATLFPIDISDPKAPRLMASWTMASQTHGGSTTEDGARSYVCQQQAPPKDALLILDTSEIVTNRANPKPRLITSIPLDDNQWCQAAWRVTYDGHPYLIQYGERSGAADCSRVADNWASYGYPRIFDLADERHPKLVATMLLGVDLPQHCEQVTGEGAFNGLGYSVHHCTPDRLYNPTILACDYFGAGMRVTDIRDPRHPVEIGYYNPGTTAVVGTGARPVVRTDRKEIWFTNDVQGFYVVRFEDGIWPFAGSAPCPEFDDWLFATYNPTSRCPTASLDGIGKPAPGRAVPAGARRPVPKLAARAAPTRRGFRVSGRLIPAEGISLQRGCRGSVRLTAAGITRTLRVSRTCTFAATLTTKRRKLTVSLRFRGNSALAPVSRRTLARKA